MNVGLTKGQLRNIVLSRLKEQTEQQREHKSKLIERRLLKEEEFIKAERILFYLAFDGEVNTESMINQARGLGKKIYVPLCDSKHKSLTPCALNKDSILEKGPYQTLEPQDGVELPVDKLDLVVVPGLAFDKSGNRLGRGKGYYDRFLQRLSSRTPSIGLAFDFQIFPDLPVEHTDLPVDKLLFA
jgi:5-formyltetrahydrofolate cyclo-ligase